MLENKANNLNPIFKNNLIITKDYHSPSFLNRNSYYYEIYKLNIVKNAIYIAFASASKDQIKIIKMNLSDKKITELISLKYDNFPQKIKYFYDKIKNKEYLFISFYEKIIIYLIQTEKEFKTILEYEQKGEAGGRLKPIHILPIHDFEIFLNKFDNNIYLIVTFVYYVGCGKDVRDIKLFKFNNNKLDLINEIKSNINNKLFITTLFLIWEDNISKKIFLVTNIDRNLKIIDIFNFKESYIDRNSQIDGINQDLGDKGFIIQNKENDYLYLGNNEGQLRIINLRTKQIIKQLNIEVFINFIDNWNDKYIIIGNFSDIYVFDIEINKIISKYSFNFNKNKAQKIKKFLSEEYNFYSLCIGESDKIIRLFF